MKMDMVAPCQNCPFRTDVQPFITWRRAIEICDSITRKQQSFPCHKTLTFDDDGDAVRNENEQHCAGALIMLEKMKRPNQWMRICERLGGYDHTKLKMESPVYKDDTAMINAHRKTVKK